MLFSIALYGLLGYVMTVSGVGIFDNPLGFISILVIVILIDLQSYIKAP